MKDVINYGLFLFEDYYNRRYAHQYASNARFPYKQYTMYPIATGLTLDEARALEQTLFTAYTLKELANSINSISQRNLGKFKDYFARLSSLLSSYL